MAARAGLSLPATAFPVLALGFVILAAVVGLNIAAPASPFSWILSAAMIAIMLGAVFAAVEFADVIAHRVGEPYGTLVLTLAVTVIEVALIESIVLTPNSSPALARDTVFAVIMIVCNGLVGLCIMVGSLRHYEQEFQVSGASLYLNVLGALSVLTLILPNYTSTIVGPSIQRPSSCSLVRSRSCCTVLSSLFKRRGTRAIFALRTSLHSTAAVYIPPIEPWLSALSCF